MKKKDKRITSQKPKKELRSTDTSSLVIESKDNESIRYKETCLLKK